MKVSRRPVLLVFEDAVGITEGYKKIFEKLLEDAGLGQRNVHTIKVSAYKHFPKQRLLSWQKTRKQPGFNLDPINQAKTRIWVETQVRQHNASGAIVMDPALLFIMNPDWGQATLDRLRGGTYLHLGIPFVVTLPITAWHNKMKAKDIAKLNEGFVDKADFEEYRSEDEGEIDEDDESQMEWQEPIIVPYGRVVLEFDLQKMARFFRRMQEHEVHNT